MVDVAYGNRGVNEQEGDVAAVNRAFHTVQREPLDTVLEALLATKPGGVDGDEGAALHLEANIHSVPRRARDFTDDHALLAR